ncbi:hypothetical protein GCM10023340_11610 [Nocardioides marinquilinus]|uniref:Uncharacterized protein n=1 Tax=Nocardioides marinquilinus TaxID=1210400 RepID=A0ABP9PDY2_9ACTN
MSRIGVLRRLAVGIAVAGVSALVPVAGCGEQSSGGPPERQAPNPVIAGDGRAVDYPNALLPGVLTLQDGCLALDGHATLWPTGSVWDDDDQAVVLPDGARAAVGEDPGLGGGIVPPSIASNYSGTAREPVLRCVRALGTPGLALIGP